MQVVKPKKYEQKHGGFTTLSNKALRNETLSDGAFRLWMYLLTQSKDYVPTEARLAKKLGVSQKTVHNRVHELREARYLMIEQLYDSKSLKSRTEWFVTEFPISDNRTKPP